MHRNQEAMHAEKWFAQPEMKSLAARSTNVVKEIEMSVQNGGVILDVGTVTRARSDRCTRIISCAMHLITVPNKKRKTAHKSGRVVPRNTEKCIVRLKADYETLANALGVRTCSGRTPRPTSRAGIRRSRG